jgi:hypothetical protein
MKTSALTLFVALCVGVFWGLVNANIRHWAVAKGHDTYLLKIWNALPEWGHKLLAGWPPLRQLWWLWLALGLTGGLGISLRVLAPTQLAPTLPDYAPRVAAPSAGSSPIVESARPAAAALPTPPTKAPEALTPEDIATKISIWQSVDGQMNEYAKSLNLGYMLIDNWSKMNNADFSAAYNNFRAALISTVIGFEGLRSSYPKYQDIVDILDPKNRPNLFQTTDVFRQQVSAFPAERPSDYEIKIRPYSGAFRRDLDISSDWQSSTRRAALAKIKELEQR